MSRNVPLFFAALLAVLAAQSCFPQNLSKRCQDRIGSCLSNCPPPLGESVNYPDNDGRSECERHCHEMQCED